MSDEPYIPFYKPYGMTDEEFQHEVEIAKEKHAEWESQVIQEDKIEYSEDYTDNPEYQQWLEELAKECTCCSVCWDVPCGGCMAGGMCDNMCICEDDECDEECDVDEYLYGYID